MLAQLASHTLLEPSSETAQPKAHRELLSLAAMAPHQEVSIIVRVQPGSTQAADFVLHNGGVITHRFPFINGFAATLRAGFITQLALLESMVWISPDSEMVSDVCTDCVAVTTQISTWTQTIGLDTFRGFNPDKQGQGVTVAVVDSGITPSADFNGANGNSRVIQQVNKNIVVTSPDTSAQDQYGHGTHVAGLIGGDGRLSGGKVVGVAPRVNIINVRVNDRDGLTTGKDVIDALQWIHDNRRYNPLPRPDLSPDDPLNLKIKVVNLSLNSNTYEDQNTAALNSAVEMLWFAGVTVVVSAGNNGKANDGVLYPPANDPFVITVGAVDEKGTATIADDVIADFSAHGTIATNQNPSYVKPELVAPGVNLLSLGCPSCTLRNTYPQLVPSDFAGSQNYFRASGTSMSAALVSGVVAMMHQTEPNLRPDVIKYRLWVHGDQKFGPYTRYLNAAWALGAYEWNSWNTDITVAAALVPTDNPLAVYDWGNSARWGSARWGSARWGSARWGSMNLTRGNKNSIYVDPVVLTTTPTSAPFSTATRTPTSATPTLTRTATSVVPTATRTATVATATATRTATSVVPTATRTATSALPTATRTATSVTAPSTATRTATAVSSCGKTNVAKGMGTSASSMESAAYNYPGAVDGNFGTRWSSAFADPQWISIDLGYMRNICRVKLFWEYAYGKSYVIQVSNDNSSWSTIYTTTAGDGGLDDLSNLAGSGRYVRMYGTVRGNTSAGYSLWEFEVYTK